MSGPPYEYSKEFGDYGRRDGHGGGCTSRRGCGGDLLGHGGGKSSNQMIS